MKKWVFPLSLLAGAALGSVAGAGALYALVGPNAARDLKLGAWTTLENIGEAKQSPYTRARVALFGIWGLPPREVVYLSAVKDTNGVTLNSRCTYLIAGKAAPARWWSVTVYRDLFYIDNPANRYSLSMTTIRAQADGSWTIRLSPKGDGINGLAMGDKPGSIFLSYRLYQPLPGVAEDRRKIPAPTIQRVSCAS